MKFDGLNCSMETLALLSEAESRSISSENRNGAKSGGARDPVPLDEDGNPAGVARELGTGWKVHAHDQIAAGETMVLADIEGPGSIQQIWLTPTGIWRSNIIRIYYDDQEHPSVEVPVGDFFASAYMDRTNLKPLISLPVCVNPGSAFNCYWPMPFRKRVRITLENRNPSDGMSVYFQINYALAPVPDSAAYFHAQFRRTNPLAFGDVYTILDGVEGQGQFAGTYMAWQLNNNGWFGEGEIKFYLDGDARPEVSEGEIIAGSHGYPTICGTGTEDYFCGSYGFSNKSIGDRYQEYTTAYAGVSHVDEPDGVYRANRRLSMYRWHITDPIRFKQDLKITMQALGWRKHGRYLPLQDDIASVAYWYQTLPTVPFPQLPDDNFLEIN